MKQKVYFVIGILFAIAIAWFGIHSLLNQLSPCKNLVKTELKSPDGKLKAVVFGRDCGATVSENTEISILSANDILPNNEGNVFIEDRGYEPDVYLRIDLQWLEPRKLIIGYDHRTRIFKQEQEIQVSTGLLQSEKVSIEYKKLIEPQ